MSEYILKEVTTESDKKRFRRMTERLYRGDKNWVQPWDHDIESVFDPTKNKQFENGEAIRWILLDSSNVVVGRIAAFYNMEQSKIEAQPTGACGFFECINNQSAANILFDSARDWLKSKGMEAMDGPVNFGDRMMWWGVLVEGYEMPIYGMNYNHPYYCELIENYGFQNYFNQYSYRRQLDYYEPMDQALYDKADRLYQNPEYSFECINLKKKDKAAHDFMTIYNSAWADFTGVKPLTIEHANEQMNAMSAIIDPEILYFAYHNGTPVGFFLMVPDINPVVQKMYGKFGLWQKLKFVYYFKIRKIQNRIAGLIFGIASEYQGRGIESGLIRQFEDYTVAKRNSGKIQYNNLEMSWIGDFNPVMMRMCEGPIKGKKHKRHVTYRYLFDREKPFTRAPRLGRKKKTTTTESPAQA